MCVMSKLGAIAASDGAIPYILSAISYITPPSSNQRNVVPVHAFFDSSRRWLKNIRNLALRLVQDSGQLTSRPYALSK